MCVFFPINSNDVVLWIHLFWLDPLLFHVMKLIEFLTRLSKRTNELIKKLANGSLFLCASVCQCVCETSAWTLKVIYFLALTWERLSQSNVSVLLPSAPYRNPFTAICTQAASDSHYRCRFFSTMLTNCEQLTSCLQLQINHIFGVGGQCGGLERSMLCSLTRANKENSSSFFSFFFPQHTWLWKAH